MANRPVEPGASEWAATPRADLTAHDMTVSAPRSPYFSVIVMAWQRREFLEAALDSVLAQSVPTSDYEIIVVKGWADDRLDLRLRSIGAQLIETTSSDQGPALAAAVAHAHGEVIAFLDDDDEFEPEKLATLRAEFGADPSLVVLRHRNRAIDVHGIPLPAWPDCDWPALTYTRAWTVSSADEKRTHPTFPMHNLSSIAVRRSAVLPFLGAWGEIDRAADSMVFLSALAQEGSARADPRRLTRRRIHPSSSHENFSSDGLGPPPNLDRLRRLIRSHARQRAMVAGTPAQPSAEWIDLILRFDAAMSSTEFLDPSLADDAAMIRAIVRERQPFRLWILGFSLLRRIAPKSGIRLWWTFCRLRHRTLFPRVDYALLFPKLPTRAPRPSAGHTP